MPFLKQLWSENLSFIRRKKRQFLSGTTEVMSFSRLLRDLEKSLVALSAHFLAMSEGKRSFYTCPIKALVNEKFFSLCDEFGADNVGMLTGDVSINRDAPIICCTAEILANIAIRPWDDRAVDVVIMDEFHYYSDKERGVAWQIPLLTMPKPSLC